MFDETFLSLEKLASTLAGRSPILDRTFAAKPKLLKLPKENGTFLYE